MKTGKIIQILTLMLISLLMSVGISAATGIPIMPTFATLSATSYVCQHYNIIPKGILSVSLANLVNLDYPEGECNIGGLGTNVYIVAVNNVDTFAEIADIKATIEDEVTLVGSHVLKAGAQWIRIQTPQEMNELLGESQGNKGSKFFRFTGNVFHNSTSKQALGNAKLLNNASVLAIFVDIATGQMIQLGSEALPAQVSSNINWGKAAEDEKGVTFTIEWPTCCPYVYEGSITPVDGDASI